MKDHPRVKPMVFFAALLTTLIKNPIRFTLRARTYWIKRSGNGSTYFHPKSSAKTFDLIKG